jgi:hypothetical protein
MDQPGPALTRSTAIVHSAALKAGRDPSTLGIEGRIRLRSDDTRWQPLGAVTQRRADGSLSPRLIRLTPGARESPKKPGRARP